MLKHGTVPTQHWLLRTTKDDLGTIAALSAVAPAAIAFLMWNRKQAGADLHPQDAPHRVVETRSYRQAARVATLRLLILQSDLQRMRRLVASERFEGFHIDALLEGNMLGTQQTLVDVRTFLPELIPELRGKMEEQHVRREKIT